MKARKTWREKLEEAKDLPRVIKLTGAARQRWGGATLVIVAPVEVDALMQRVPRGRVTTINALRAALARRHRAEAACPITTGIFAWIAAQRRRLAAEGHRCVSRGKRVLLADLQDSLFQP